MRGGGLATVEREMDGIEWDLPISVRSLGKTKRLANGKTVVGVTVLVRPLGDDIKVWVEPVQLHSYGN